MITTAAILAGGFGTRLQSVVNDRSKVIAPVAGQPFIIRLLDQLAGTGISRVILCTGYLADSIRDTLGNRYQDLELHYSVEQTPLGTGGALRNAADLIDGELLLVMNGDSYCDCNLPEFIACHAASGANAGMVLATVDDVSRFGAVVTDERSQVKSFVEKGGKTGTGQINAGIYLLPSADILALPFGEPVSLERELFPKLVEQGLYGFQTSGAFIDIGIPEEYRRAQTFFPDQQKGRSL